MFSKENKFLICIFLQSNISNNDSCSEILIQEKLKYTYKQQHKMAKFWEKQGMIKSFTHRGGVTSYKITELGFFKAVLLQKKQKMMIILCVGILLVGIVSFFIVY